MRRCGHVATWLLGYTLSACSSLTVVLPVRSHHFVERPVDARACAYEGRCESSWNEWNPGAFVEYGARRGSGAFATAGALRNSWSAFQAVGGGGYWWSVAEPARGFEIRAGIMVGLTYHDELAQSPLGPFLGTVALQFGPFDTVWLPGDEGGALLFRLRIGSW